VTNLQAAGEAIARWNQMVRERFLLRPGKGAVTLTLNT